MCFRTDLRGDFFLEIESKCVLFFTELWWICFSVRHEDTIDEARIRNTRPKTTDTFTEFKLNLTARVGGASFKPLRGESRRPRPSADRFGESAWPRKRCHHVITTIRSTQGRRAVIGADTRQSKSAKLVPEVKVILRSLVVAFALWSSMKDYQPNMSVT